MPKRLDAVHAEVRLQPLADSPTPVLLTIPQVAEILQCSDRTVHNLLNDGRLPSFKIGTL